MKKLFTIFVLVLITLGLSAQVSKNINLSTAGTLSSLLTTTEKTTVTNLTVTGNIDARDVKCMRDEMTVLAVIDMSLANIKAYTGTDGTFYDETKMYNYLANEMPEGSFSKGSMVPKFSLTAITLPNSLTSIGDGPFTYCSNLSSISIPSSVTNIGTSAFQRCTGLTSITIPSSVTTIGTQAFYSCTNLISIKISSGVTSIGTSAFLDCTRLKTIITLNPVPPLLSTDAFLNVSPSNVYVPIGSVSAYKAANGWSQFNIVENILKVSTQSVASITLSTAILNANLDYIVIPPVNSYGFCWNTNGSPTVADNKVDNGQKNTTGAFSNSISGLTNGTKYYVKAFATDAERTVYGSEVSFTTASLPAAAGTISGLQTVCQGQNSVTYTVPVISYATSYIWTLPNGATGTSTTNSITINYAKTFISANISVKGHNEWGDGTPSTIAITANLLPENAGIISGNTTVCQGENSIVYSVPVINNALSYSWTLPTGATGTSTTNSITVYYSKTALSGNVTVKGHNDCGDGVVSFLPVTVNPLPVISTTNKTIICGASVSLSPAISYTGSGILRYKWIPSTGLSNDTIANPTAIITNNITYTLTVITPTGCSTFANVNITVSPLTANAGTDKTVICGGSVLLGVTTNYSGNGTLKYKWTPSTGLNNDTIANPTATAIQNTTYTVLVTTPTGCSATATVGITIQAMTKPEIGIVGVIGNNNRVAWNKPVSTGIASYGVYRETSVTDVYEKVGSVPYDSLSTFVDYQSSANIKSNKYRLSIFDKNGFESPQSNAHKTMHLSINKGQNNTWNLIWEPYEGFTVSTYNIYRGTSINNLNFLDATSASSTQYTDPTAPTGDVFYQLEVISPNLVNPTKAPGVQKSANIILASYSSSRSNIATNLTKDQNQLGTEGNNISIYPNPVKNEFKIDFEGGSEFEILNLIGIVIYYGNLKNTNVVQATNLQSGIYLIRFKAGNTYEYRRLIKE